jgi:ApeA N-terminal domain 1
MNEATDRPGAFWVPGASEQSVVGHLQVGPTELSLTLHGSLTPLNNLLAVTEVYPVIHGVTEDAKEVTLLSCRSAGVHMASPGYFSERLWVGSILLGAHLDETALKFDKLAFRCDHLAEWVGRSGLEVGTGTSDSERWTARYRLPDRMEAKLDDSTVVSIEFGGQLARPRPGRLEVTENLSLQARVTSATNHRQLAGAVSLSPERSDHVRHQYGRLRRVR